MRIYLDNCCYNRPFDPQVDLRIHLETVAKMRVQALMKSGDVEYVWSDALDYEIGQSPNFQEPDMIAPWKLNAVEMVAVDDAVISRGEEIERFGVRAMDAIHIACAEAGSCDWFLTTDKGITKKLQSLGGMRIANPVEFVMED